MSSLSEKRSLVDVQKMVIGASLNSMLMFVFLMGLYTLVFIGAVYAYVTRKPGQNRVILATICASWIDAFAILCIKWYLTDWAFVHLGDSRSSIFLATSEGTPPIQFVSGILQKTQYILADGLLIWRCFRVCSRRWILISAPLMFFVVEILLCIILTVMDGMMKFGPNSAAITLEESSNILGGTLGVVIALTSVIATLMICRQILVNTSDSNYFRKKYTRTIRMLIESASLYTVSVVARSITFFVQIGFSSANVSALSAYSTAIVIITSGLAPTLMVAQVALLSPNASEVSTSRIASVLQFVDTGPTQPSHRHGEGAIIATGKNWGEGNV